MDLIGEFHPVSSKGNRFALTAVCMLTGFTFCIPLKSKQAEDVIKAYIDHICCTFGPSRKILTDNGTEFKNKLMTEVFEKLTTTLVIEGHTRMQRSVSPYTLDGKWKKNITF